jgi:hypothetical protein
LEFKVRFAAEYPSLFGERNEEDYSELQQFFGSWGWYNSIYQLAQGDITRFEEIGRLPARKCFTLLTYETQKNEIERQQIARQNDRLL